jgi:hypothetical protein
MKITRLHVYGIIACVIAIGIIGFAASQYDVKNDSHKIVMKENPTIEIHSTDRELTEEEKTAINLVQNYQGKDDEGNSIAYVVGKIVSTKYSDDVLLDPATKLGWSAYADPDTPDLYGVTFDFKSNNDEFTFLWYVNLKTHLIYDTGGGAGEILKIVDSEK